MTTVTYQHLAVPLSKQICTKSRGCLINFYTSMMISFLGSQYGQTISFLGAQKGKRYILNIRYLTVHQDVQCHGSQMGIATKYATQPLVCMMEETVLEIM